VWQDGQGHHETIDKEARPVTCPLCPAMSMDMATHEATNKDPRKEDSPSKT
jgi:hypothetical protein